MILELLRRTSIGYGDRTIILCEECDQLFELRTVKALRASWCPFCGHASPSKECKPSEEDDDLLNNAGGKRHNEMAEGNLITELKPEFSALLAESMKYRTCMALSISESGSSVELILDTSANYIAEWIPGEGGDICLYRDRDSGRIIGCHLPLKNRLLSVHYDGPIRVNSGFRHDEPV